MSNNIIVVKLGGTEGVDFSAICQDAARLLSQGQRLVLIHGGSAEANQVNQAINALKADQSRSWRFTVQYHGKSESLEIRAAMDDLGNVDLDFSASPDAAPEVRAKVDGYLNSRSH